MDDTKKIIIVSDGTGRTAKRLLDAVLVQYSRKDLDFSLLHIYPQIRDRNAIDRVLKEVEPDYLVVYSIISADLSKYFTNRLKEMNVLNLNVLEQMIDTLSMFLGVHPGYEPGILHVIDDNYYMKVDAIGYTVEHDDGMGPFLEEADLVLLGPSRTCKTPISMYLACNYGLKVANIPVVRDATLTENLLRKVSPMHKNQIIGLLMQPDILVRVREERTQHLSHSVGRADNLQLYYDHREVGAEIKFCRDLYRVRGWKSINVTRRAIEEIALEILDKLGLGRR
ncbi:MAG: kinase/pyrophosphorylase [candidate division Zixibacteria bacterium]|nr:kinase/pyrophosphorylase [candidate division Zixibacteria bacterium]